MKFKIDQRVKLNRDHVTASGTVPMGTRGTITALFPFLQLYQVQFDGFGTRFKVPERDLEPA
jgi:hypothetical protein